MAFNLGLKMKYIVKSRVMLFHSAKVPLFFPFRILYRAVVSGNAVVEATPTDFKEDLLFTIDLKEI